MSIGSIEPVGTYSRPQPPEWSRLVEVAEAGMEGAAFDEPMVDVANALFDAVQSTDNESLEQARYYGLGLVICGVAKVLHQPKVHQETTDRLAADFTDYWRVLGSHSDAGLHISDIRGDALSRPFKGLVDGAYGSLSPSSRLVADVLQTESRKRRFALEYPGRFSVSERGYYLGQVLNTDMHPAAVAVGREFTTAASTVLRAALGKIHDRKLGDTGMSDESDEVSEEAIPMPRKSPALSEFISADELRQLELEKVALRSAVLRIDEFRDGIKDFIDVDEYGTPIFRRDLMVPSRDLASPEISGNGLNRLAVLHESRLKCPAVFVAGAIPMTVGIIKEAIVKAQEQAEARIAELARKEAARQADHEAFKNAGPYSYPTVGW